MNRAFGALSMNIGMGMGGAQTSPQWELMYDLKDGASLATFAGASGAAVVQESDGVTASYDSGAVVESFTGLKIEGDWDVSDGDIFSFDMGFPSTSTRTYMRVMFCFDTGTTFNNYVDISPVWTGNPKFPRFKININKSDGNIVGTPDWTHLRRIEIRLYRLAPAGIADEFKVYKVYNNVTQKTKVILTFDDADETVYDEAYLNYLKPNNLPATIYINSGTIGDVGKVTLSELQEMYADNWAMSNHSATHAALAVMPEVTRVGSVATAVIGASLSHGLSPLDEVEITGFEDDAYNGLVTVDTTPNAYTFTYTVAGTPATPALGWGAYHILTDQQIEDEITAVTDYLSANGMTRAKSHIAYPFGYFSTKVIDILSSLGFISSRATTFGGSPMFFQVSNVNGLLNNTRMPSIRLDSTETAANVLAQVDNAILRGSGIFIYGHTIVTPATTDDEFPVAEFAALVTGLKSRVDAGSIDMVPIDRISN